jgi:hypothetical protein
VYPITVQVEYVEERNRLTTFFRYFMLIPLVIVGFFIAIGAMIAIVISWFAILITGQNPEGLRNFEVGAMRYFARMNAYYYLLTDTYPPFNMDDDPAYPVRYDAGPALESQNRLTVFFRYLLALPAIIINYVVTIVMAIAVIAGWLVTVFTGKMPRGIHDAIATCFAWQVRVGGYVMLLTDDYPPLFEFEPPGGALSVATAPAGVTAPPPPPDAGAPPPPPPADPSPPSVPGVPGG